MNVYLPNLRLPSTYQEVEYIQSSGTQYIDTGYVLTSNPGCDIDFSFLGGDSNSWIPIWGSRNDSYGTNTGNFCLYVNSSSLYVTPNYAGFDPGTSSGLVISSNTKYNIFNNKGQFYIDGIYKSACSTTNTYVSNIPRTFVLFGVNNYDETIQIRGCRMKLYGCKLYNNNVLVRDFVPCYRKSDSVIGLYDLVNNQFYTNSGTGTFSKGNDVTMTMLKNAYIGEVYEYSYTFKGKTSSQIQNEFTLLTGTIQTDSNGVTGSSSTDCRIGHDIPSLTNARKITISNTIICQAGSNTAGSTGVGKGSGWGNGYADFHTHGSDFGGIRVTMYYGGDHYGNTVGNVTNATYNPTMTIDLENKTITGVLSGFSNSTLSLTDSQVAEIRSYTYLLVYVSKTRSTISDVSITIEY